MFVGESMEKLILQHHFLCIDLKSFFACCECLSRNLDPFTTPLIVADANQKGGAMTLAVSPFLKNQGIKGRTRVYQLPKNINYLIAQPRMELYAKKSQEVISVYLEFFAQEDIHIYSIDEVFLDVTNYLNLYQKTDHELALTVLQRILKKAGLPAVCGIGPNILLAKIAMDVEAKNNQDNIAEWSSADISTKLWPITPLSKIWGIGQQMEKNLNLLGIKSVFDLAHYDIGKLKSRFGSMGEELWHHANGIDNSQIKDWKVAPKTSSYSHSQVLFKDYYGDNIKLILDEMINFVAFRLRKNNKQGFTIGLGIDYSKTVGGGFYHITKLINPTNDAKTILNNCLNIFDRYYNNLPIRKVVISISQLITNNYCQLSLFEDLNKVNSENKLNLAVDSVNYRFGLNTVLKASSLLTDSTIKARNRKIGD